MPMKPVSFITSRISANGQGAKCDQRASETAHFTFRFAGRRFPAFASTAASIEKCAKKVRRLVDMVEGTIRPDNLSIQGLCIPNIPS